MPLYVFDANVWITLARTQPPDVYVNFWRQVDAAIADGVIRCPEEVLHELEAGTDGFDAVMNARAGLFIPLDEPVMSSAGEISDACQGLVDPDSDRNRADPFVVALARVNGGTVVTMERPRRGPTGRPRIPDACDRFGIPWLHWLNFLRLIGWQI